MVLRLYCRYYGRYFGAHVLVYMTICFGRLNFVVLLMCQLKVVTKNGCVLFSRAICVNQVPLHRTRFTYIFSNTSDVTVIRATILAEHDMDLNFVFYGKPP